MAASDPAWTEFFATAAGAAATMAGLLIVAISVNVQRILDFRQLPSRAAASIGALVLNLIASMAALVPQPARALAAEVLVFALVVWLVQVWAARQMLAAPAAERRPLPEMLVSIAVSQAQVLPFLAGAALLWWGAAGLYWIAAGVIATFAAAVFNAWVLLVEILR
jgi:hypothetical protein